MQTQQYYTKMAHVDMQMHSVREDMLLQVVEISWRDEIYCYSCLIFNNACRKVYQDIVYSDPEHF